MTELSDELLVAYVDGQLARKQTRAIDRVLEQDDVLDARVIALKHAHARLEAAFEAILAGEEAEISTIVAEPLDDGFWVPWRTFKIAAATAGVLIALALAVLGFGWPLKVPSIGSAPGVGAVPSVASVPDQVEIQVSPKPATNP
jgi:anti-sigma factor RsiW